MVTPALAKLLLEQYPSLSKHACKSGRVNKNETPHDKRGAGKRGGTSAHQDTSKNARGAQSLSTFGDHILGALLPHAAEHLTIELLVRRYPGQGFAGNTSWLSREEQTMRVRVSLPESGGAEAVLRAFSDAIGQLNKFLSLCQRQNAQEPLL